MSSKSPIFVIQKHRARALHCDFRLEMMDAFGGIKGKNSPLRAFYNRLVGRGKPKKLTPVVSARKILVWSWAVYKSNTPFDAARFDCNQ